MKRSVFLLLLGLAACSGDQKEPKNENMSQQLEPPKAKKIPKELEEHGTKRLDPYFWMRLSDEQKEAENKDEQTRDVLAYLEAENNYTKAILGHTKGFQDKLFEEMKGRIKEDDQSVPYFYNKYWYYTRFEKGKDYAYYCRNTEANLDPSKEEVLIDGPERAKKHEYWSLGDLDVSPNNEILGFSEDTLSRRIYTIRFKDIKTNKLLKDELKNTSGGITWANDNKTVFYSKQDPITLRSHQIWRHSLGTSQKDDVLIYEEKDETFNVGVSITKSKKYLVIASSQTLSDEYRILEADNPLGNFRLFQPRERNLEYNIDHYEDKFYIVTNLDAQNFRLMTCPLNQTTKANWKELIPHRNDVFLEDIEIFKNFLVISERKGGLSQMRIRPWSGQAEHYLSLQDPTYTIYTSINPEFDTEILRFGYSSLTTPSSTYDYNMQTKERKLLKQTEVLGGKFKIEDYQSEYIHATAKDGTKVPISLVYHKNTKRDGTAPLLLYGYGSYGYSLDAYFSSTRLSLLERGFIFAIAHIRGGQELGRAWYEDGKLLKKKNTFTDFIACGAYLVENKYAAKDKLFAMGGSAGGLLMGAVINLAPDMWRGVVASVPFVDVISTMWDESIPLTTGEFDEWGNPKDKTYYDYILSYSPYDNIKAMNYPNLLVLTGYWDSQVQYWEPAKWVAKLRDTKTDQNQLLLHTNMDAGHGGKSGRFEALKEVALEYVFMFNLLGIKE